MINDDDNDGNDGDNHGHDGDGGGNDDDDADDKDNEDDNETCTVAIVWRIAGAVAMLCIYSKDVASRVIY